MTRVIDYVNGREDLSRKLIRAIGQPCQRFAEDRLRMLRAIRFASTLGFEIESGTWSAIKADAKRLRSSVRNESGMNCSRSWSTRIVSGASISLIRVDYWR